jgi:hypothetical protein
VSPLRPRSFIPQGDHPRPSSTSGSQVQNQKRPSRNPSPTASINHPISIPRTPSPFQKTTQIRAGGIDLRGLPVPL